MKKSIVVGALGVAILGSGMWAGEAFAQSNYGPNYTAERHAQMTEIFANKDYAAWKNLMGDRGVTRKITQENFAKFAEVHTLEVAGKTEEAKKIREELGLGAGRGEGRKEGRGIHREENRGENRGGNFTDQNGDGTCDRMQ